MTNRTNVVLVHGAWADGSCWRKATPLLAEKGYEVTAAQIPLTSLEDDIAVTRRPDPAAAQQFMAKRMSAVTRSVPASHASFMSHPDEVASIIELAASHQ